MTALVHDPENIRHSHPGHAERPERYTAVMAALAAADLPAEMARLPVRPAREEEILRVHRPAMIDRIANAAAHGGGFLDPDTYCTSESWKIARRAAGGLMDLCAAVARGQQANGLALLRPPGHHATAGKSMGFCLINHVALAAKALQAGSLSDRVAIVDIDVHHGNGTRDIFAEDASVFYASTHQYPHYPGTGPADDRGAGLGRGFTLNLPLAAGAGDDTIIPAYSDVIVPAVRDFRPDFILVSAGFDAHRDDPLADLTVTTDGYLEIIRILVAAAGESCSGRIVFSLEGGYDLEALAACVTGTARILLGASRENSP